MKDAEVGAKCQNFRSKRRTREQDRAEQDDDNAHGAHGYASVRVT